jgi:hypothetical protein
MIRPHPPGRLTYTLIYYAAEILTVLCEHPLSLQLQLLQW